MFVNERVGHGAHRRVDVIALVHIADLLCERAVAPLMCENGPGVVHLPRTSGVLHRLVGATKARQHHGKDGAIPRLFSCMGMLA